MGLDRKPHLPPAWPRKPGQSGPLSGHALFTPLCQAPKIAAVQSEPQWGTWGPAFALQLLLVPLHLFPPELEGSCVLLLQTELTPLSALVF